MRKAKIAFLAVLLLSVAGVLLVCSKINLTDDAVTSLVSPVTQTFAASYTKSITWAGYTWYVKSGSGGPGPNNWSSSSDNVWVDSAGQLHLKITKVNGVWYCAEVESAQSFGYHKYIFYVNSRIDQLDKNVVGGIFLYYDDTHEHDIEFAQWGVSGANRLNYSVQPADTSGNHVQYAMSLSGTATTHIINWWSGGPSFTSLYGWYETAPNTSSIIKQWTYTGSDNFAPCGERIHIDLWLNKGNAPSNGKTAEMIIKNFILSSE